MKLNFFFILLFLSILSRISGQTNEYNFEHISIEHGLSQGTVNAIFQDSKGFLWFGTEEGLNRFDGYSMKVYKHTDGDSTSISGNYIWSILEDAFGNIWIGTDGGGLNRFDPKKEVFTSYFNDESDSNSLSSNVVQCFFIDSQSVLWIGTWGGGLNKYDYRKNNFERINPKHVTTENSYTNYIFTIYEDSRNNIWIGADGGGLLKYNSETNSIEKALPAANDEMKSGIVASILEYESGRLLIGTYDEGAYFFDVKSKSLSRFRSVPASATILKIYKDSRVIIWLGSFSQGVFLYDPNQMQTVHLQHNAGNAKSLSSDNIRSIYEDNANNLWIGTLVEGLNKINRKPQKFFHIKSVAGNSKSLNNNFVFDLIEDSHKEIWIGTYGGGLNRFNPEKNTFKHYINIPGSRSSVGSDIIRAIYEDSYNDIWIGTYYGGLAKYERNSDSFISYKAGPNPNDLQSDMIRTIFEDSERNLWIGTNGRGLSLYDRKTGSFINYMNIPDDSTSLSHNAILSICEDELGYLWIGTYGGGLNRFDKESGSFIHFTNDPQDKSTLSGDIVTEVYYSSKGELWVGTWGGGINKLLKDKNKFISFGEFHGLPSGIICGILEDDSGYLWVSSSKGITNFNPENYEIKNYDYNDGLQKGDFNPGAYHKSNTGMMYFGGTAGYNYFHPDSVYQSDFAAPVVITSFKKFNNEAKLKSSISFTDTIFLSYKDVNFSFEFASLDFTKPAKNNYAYILEGFDSDWITTTDRRFANYTHLDPGEYTFKVKGTNSDGIWNEKYSQISIFISPPFWGTWWFRILFAGLIVFSIVIVFRRRIEKLEREKNAEQKFSEKLLNYQEIERERIASGLHDSLGQNLLVIKNRALLGLNSKESTGSVQQLEAISEAASSAIEEVRSIAHNLHPHQLKRLGLTKAIRSIVSSIDSSGDIKFETQIDDIDGMLAKESEINVYRVIQESVNNIIKHSKAKSAQIIITSAHGDIKITIADDGVGINRKIYDEKPGQGFGLQNIDRRIKLLNGKSEINSHPGKGTKIKLTVPI